MVSSVHVTTGESRRRGGLELYKRRLDGYAVNWEERAKCAFRANFFCCMQMQGKGIFFFLLLVVSFIVWKRYMYGG